MSSTKHTPGPWSRNIKANGKYPIVFSGRNTHVACALGHGVLNPEEIEANIDLIAAAPDLLQALMAVLNDAKRRRYKLADNITEFALNTIAQARGEK